MAIDGKYDIELNTMVGSAPISLVLKTEGNSLSGNMDGHFGQHSFFGGTISGNNISWTMKLQSPVGEMKLDVVGICDGLSIEGQVQLGSFRPTPFTGKRV